MDPLYRLRVAKAAAAVYNGEIAPNMVHSKLKLPRSTVDGVVAHMTKGLPKDKGNTLQVIREACVKAGATLEGDKCYTTEEMRKGLLSVATGRMKKPRAREEYGVPERTMQRYQEMLCEILGYKSNDEVRKCAKTAEGLKKVTDACNSFSPASRGCESLLSLNEVALVKELANAKGEAGYGQTRRAMRNDMRKIVHAKGAEAMGLAKTEEQRKQAKRMIVATLDGAWLRRNLDRESKLLDTIRLSGGDDGSSKKSPKRKRASSFTKPSVLSQKRAVAGSIVKALAMRRQLENMFVELKAKGLMVGDVPLPEDIVNFDETGFGPAGFGATFQLFDQDEDGRIPRRRNIIVRTGDKHSDFWVSVSLTFFANGDILPPMVIHEGGGTNSTTIPESIAIGLPADWIVDRTPSGYQSRDGVRDVIKQLADYRKQKNRSNVAAILTIDGHDSHMDPEALAYPREQNIYPFFLIAQNSTGDQAADNGVNALLKSHYEKAYEDWVNENPSVPYTPEWFNKVFAAAWKAMMESPRTADVARGSFEKVGLCPYISSKTLTTPDANDSDSVKKYKAVLKQTTNLAIPLMDAIEAEEAKRALLLLEGAKTGGDNGGSDEEEEGGDWEEVTDVTVTTKTVKRRKGGGDERTTMTDNSFTISKAASQWAQTNFVTPANEIVKALREHRRA